MMAKSVSKQPSAGELLIGGHMYLICIHLIRKVVVTHISPNIKLPDLEAEMREICQFENDKLFTMKWIDDEGLLFTFV